MVEQAEDTNQNNRDNAGTDASSANSKAGIAGGGTLMSQKDEAEKAKDENKTPYERFEDNVREIIFNVLYVLLKNEEHTKFDTTVEVALDMFQIYSFTFSQKTAFPWKQPDIMYYFEWSFNIVQFDTVYSYIDYTSFLVVFYVAILVVILVIIDIFYVSYSFQQKKFKYVWPLKLLRNVCGLLVTVFFLNFLELYANFVKCAVSEDDPTKQVMDLYSDVECWQGLFILHASFSVAVSFVFVMICLVAAIALFETKESPNDVCAKVTSRPDFIVLIVKIVILYQYSFFYQEENHWFVIITTFLMSLIMYKGFRDNWPYYSDYMNRLMSLVTGLFLWGNFVLIIVKLLEKTDFDGGLQIYFLGLPLVGLMIVFGKDERVELLNRNINNFQQGEEMALQIRYFLNLVQTRETDRHNAIILRGYIYHHEDSCSYPECCLAQYKQLMKQTIAQKNQGGKDSKSTSSQANQQAQQNQPSMKSHKKEMQKLLLQHAKNMYRAAMRKFPTCTALRIQYSFFLLEHLGKKQEAKAEFMYANQFSPSFEEKFIIFRYLKMMEDYDDVGDSGGNGGGEEMDVVAKFAYESSLRQFHESILEAAYQHAQFWNYLKKDQVKMAKLNKCGEKINAEVVKVEHFWEQLQKLNPNQPDVMKTYARYLSQVLNDNQSGQELMARAKEATSGKQNFLDADGSLTRLDQSDQPCIIVSGNPDEIGTITQWSRGASRVFGYQASEVIGKNVEILMPQLYAKHHSKVLRSAIQRGPEHIPTKERFVFAMNKSGYIFPVFLQLKLIQPRGELQEEDDELGGQFISIFKIDKKLMSSNIAFMLVDRDRRIQAISSSCISMLYLDLNRLTKLNNNGAIIDQFAPEIFGGQDSSLAERQFYPIEWIFESEFDRQNTRDSKLMQQVSIPDSIENGFAMGSLPKQKTLNITQERGTFMCSVSSLMMGDIGEVSQCIRLETVTIEYVDAQDGTGNKVAVATTGTAAALDINGSPTKKQRGKQKNFPIPQFQFHYDSIFKRGFIGEVISPNEDLMLNKNLDFLKKKKRLEDQLVSDNLILDQFTSSMAGFDETITDEKGMLTAEDVLLVEKENANQASQDDTNRSVDLSQREPLITSGQKSNGEQDLSMEDGISPLKLSSSGTKGSSKGSKKLRVMELHQMMQRKKDWPKNIQTYHLVDGYFQPKISQEELKRQMEIEEQKRNQEELEEEQVGEMSGFESLSGNLNSKKALQNSLKDKRPISSITRLKFVMNFAMICLITLAAVDYSIIGNSFKEINDNFNLIQKSYGRVSEFQRVAFDIRALIMINEGLLNQTTANYISIKGNQTLDFRSFLRNDIKDALAQLYEYQAALSLSPLSLSPKQKKLFYEKSVPLYFKDQEETIKTLKFTINEAILQLLSAIFTSKHLNFTDFTESNEDLHFININIYSDLLMALRLTSENYVNELLARADGEFKSIITLFLISAFTLLITLAILFPVVRSVNSARLKILTLFVDIPYTIAYSLSAKCQKFIVQETESSQNKDQGNSDIGSAGGEGVGRDNDDLLGGGQGSSEDPSSKKKQKNRARVPIFQSAMTDNKFFMQFGFAVLVLLGYFVAMMIISLQYTSRIKIITEEMNLVSQSESYYAFAQNIQREMFYDKDKKVLGEDSFKIASDTLEEVFVYQQYFLNKHIENRDNLNIDYLNTFDQFQKQSICGQTKVIKFNLVPFDCKDYSYGQLGMQVVITRYFELLKESMKTYVHLTDLFPGNFTRVTRQLVNSEVSRELYVLQFRFLGDSFRNLVSRLTSLTNQEYQQTIDIKVIAFVVFVISICLAYLALWLPFVINMTKDMWRSKSMLSIIPVEVIIRMPRIYQFLLKQSFSEIKVNGSAGENTTNQKVEQASESGRTKKIQKGKLDEDYD